MNFQRHYNALQRTPVNKWRLVVVAVLSLIALSMFINMRFLISKSNQNKLNDEQTANEANDASNVMTDQKEASDKGGEPKKADSLEAKKAALKKRLEDITKEITGRKKDFTKKLVVQNEVKLERRDSKQTKSEQSNEDEETYEDYKRLEDEEDEDENENEDEEDVDDEYEEDEEEQEKLKDYEDYAENDDFDEDYGSDDENREEEDERMDDNSKEIKADTDLFKTVLSKTKVKLNSELKPVPYKETPLILWYNPVSSFLGRHMLSPATPCPKLCEFTEQVSQISKSLVVVFHVPTAAPPIKKVYQQAYTTFSMESVAYYPGLEDWRDLVDWEMSYRYSVAEVWTPYFGKGTPLREPPSPKTAKAPVSMFISNCGSRNNRESYYKELMKYIKVDSYGRCVHNVEGHNWPDKLDVIKNYKFYLAFENSNTPDYVTEKVYHGLRAGSVPIYLGAPNVDTFVPPNSIIKAEDFESPKALAEYLLELDKDDEKYNKYLEWKTADWGEFEEVRDKTALDARCRICIRAHSLSSLLYPKETAEAERRKMEEQGGDDAIDEVEEVAKQPPPAQQQQPPKKEVKKETPPETVAAPGKKVTGAVPNTNTKKK